MRCGAHGSQSKTSRTAPDHGESTNVFLPCEPRSVGSVFQPDCMSVGAVLHDVEPLLHWVPWHIARAPVGVLRTQAWNWAIKEKRCCTAALLRVGIAPMHRTTTPAPASAPKLSAEDTSTSCRVCRSSLARRHQTQRNLATNSNICRRRVHDSENRQPTACAASAVRLDMDRQQLHVLRGNLQARVERDATSLSQLCENLLHVLGFGTLPTLNSRS